MSTPNDRRPVAAERLYLNTRQAAHRLCLSVRKLEAMRRAGKGPRFRRHGRLVFYHVDDLEAWSLATAEGGDSDD
jgi:hypothetical protein